MKRARAPAAVLSVKRRHEAPPPATSFLDLLPELHVQEVAWWLSLADQAALACTCTTMQARLTLALALPAAWSPLWDDACEARRRQVAAAFRQLAEAGVHRWPGVAHYATADYNRAGLVWQWHTPWKTKPPAVTLRAFFAADDEYEHGVVHPFDAPHWCLEMDAEGPYAGLLYTPSFTALGEARLRLLQRRIAQEPRCREDPPSDVSSEEASD